MLILARVVQGLGAALMAPQTMAVIMRTFPVERRGAPMGLWGSVAGIAMLVGPLLGELAGIDGVQIGNLDWQLTENTLKAIQPDVLKAAFDHAVQRAEWIAAAAGLGAVEAVAVRDDAPPMFARPMMARAMMADSATPSIDLDPEDVDVSVMLSVEFSAR